MDNRYIRQEHSRQRIGYMDALKGIAMLCVIYGHVFHYLTPDPTPLLGYVYKNFYLGLFFVISGYFTVLTPTRPLGKSLIDKTRYILVPTIACGLLYISIYSMPLKELLIGFAGRYKGGYWFTWTLYMICLSVMPLQYIALHATAKGRANIVLWVSLAVSAALAFVWGDISRCISDGRVSMALDIVDCSMIFHYLPYYLCGMVIQRYGDRAWMVIESPVMVAAALAVYLVYLKVKAPYTYYGILVEYMQGCSGIVLALAGARWLDRRWTLGGRICRETERVGRYSLIVYLMHFFFIQLIKRVLDATGCGIFEISPVLNVVLAVVLAVAISYLCIQVSRLLRRVPPLYSLLCGRVTE